jgi:hypothetical protein
MDRSWSPGPRSHRRPVSLAVVAAAAALGAGATAAPAGAESPTAAAAKRCAPVTGATSGATWSTVQATDLRGVSCAAARRVIRRCLVRDDVGDWDRTGPAAAPGLRDGRRRIRVKILSHDVPNCLEQGPVGVGMGAERNLGATRWRNAGPFEGPFQMPPTSRYRWSWTSPVVSSIVNYIDVSTANLVGSARTTGGDVRAVWFEYGKTRDFAQGSKTPAKDPKIVAGDEPWAFAQGIRSLDAGRRYYWRAAANLDDGTPGGRTVYGAIGSFVTENYRSMGVANPCSQLDFGTNDGGITQVTEALTIVCSPRFEFVNSTGIPVSVGYKGKLTCPRDYPHNLNAGNIEVNIPKIDYTVRFNNIVNYWRSNDSARFTTFPGYQEHFAGAEAGPLVGWHEWNVDQWGYLGSTSRTQAQMWINCTDNWQAYTPEQLARGEGDDKPSTAAPPTPGNFRFVRVDGGWRGTWEAVRGVAGGVAGYQLQVDSLEDSPQSGLVVTDTDLSGFLSDAYVKAMADIYRTKRLYAHVWAISGEGVRTTRSATIAITAP